MPTSLSTDIKEHIVKWYLEDQYTTAEISERAECSIGLVSNVLRNHREFGQVNNPFKRYTGHPSSLTEDDLNFIHVILSANPSLYLDEIQQKLAAVRGVHVSIAMLLWALIASQLS
jgi:transposase